MTPIIKIGNLWYNNMADDFDYCIWTQQYQYALFKMKNREDCWIIVSSILLNHMLHETI